MCRFGLTKYPCGHFYIHSAPQDTELCSRATRKNFEQDLDMAPAPCYPLYTDPIKKPSKFHSVQIAYNWCENCHYQFYGSSRYTGYTSDDTSAVAGMHAELTKRVNGGFDTVRYLESVPFLLTKLDKYAEPWLRKCIFVRHGLRSAELAAIYLNDLNTARQWVQYLSFLIENDAPREMFDAAWNHIYLYSENGVRKQNALLALAEHVTYDRCTESGLTESELLEWDNTWVMELHAIMRQFKAYVLGSEGEDEDDDLVCAEYSYYWFPDAEAQAGAKEVEECHLALSPEDDDVDDDDEDDEVQNEDTWSDDEDFYTGPRGTNILVAIPRPPTPYPRRLSTSSSYVDHPTQEVYLPTDSPSSDIFHPALEHQVHPRTFSSSSSTNTSHGKSKPRNALNLTIDLASALAYNAALVRGGRIHDVRVFQNGREVDHYSPSPSPTPSVSEVVRGTSSLGPSPMPYRHPRNRPVLGVWPTPSTASSAGVRGSALRAESTGMEPLTPTTCEEQVVEETEDENEPDYDSEEEDEADEAEECDEDVIFVRPSLSARLTKMPIKSYPHLTIGQSALVQLPGKPFSPRDLQSPRPAFMIEGSTSKKRSAEEFEEDEEDEYGYGYEVPVKQEGTGYFSWIWNGVKRTKLFKVLGWGTGYRWLCCARSKIRFWGSSLADMG